MKEHSVTFHGLDEWFRDAFKTLGWVILSKEHGHVLKVKAYKESVINLNEHIVSKIETTKDFDKKEDLKILHSNVKVLLKTIKKVL